MLVPVLLGFFFSMGLGRSITASQRGIVVWFNLICLATLLSSSESTVSGPLIQFLEVCWSVSDAEISTGHHELLDVFL